MAFEEKIENYYVKVWRGLIFFAATVALIVGIAASVAAINGLFDSAPGLLPEVKLKDRSDELKKMLSLDNFQKSQRSEQERQAEKNRDRDPADQAVRKISENLASYLHVAFSENPPNREAIGANIRNTMRELGLDDDAKAGFYLSTLEQLSEELAKRGGGQVMLPEDKRIRVDRLMRWHAENVRQTLEKIDGENRELQQRYQQRQAAYVDGRNRILNYTIVAVGAFAVFVFAVFLFIIIRMERDFRMMAIVSKLTARQIESSIPPGQ